MMKKKVDSLQRKGDNSQINLSKHHKGRKGDNSQIS